MTVDAVLVEFDGVVADTSRIHRETLDHVLGVVGIKISDEEYWEHCAGTSLADGIGAMIMARRMALDATDHELLSHRADQRFSAHIAKGVMLAEGALSSLARLASRARLGVVSRLKRQDVEAIMALARLEDHLSFVVGAEDVSQPKPHPEGYQTAIQRLGRFRGNNRGVIIAMENSLHGIRAARAAGLQCLAVGTLPAHVVLEAEAYVESIAGLSMTTIETLLSERRRED